uniref:28 kDa Metastriate family member n=1 Tax=Rhipicephalus zambeziensis TaxID=60191 RepID=A0A224YBL6_9ACAR
MIYNVFMMKQFTKAFVCVFMLEFPRITRFIHVAAEGDATKKSIELNAHVLYDFSPNGRYKIDDDPYANAETYFSALFQKVQQSFHNISVPVTIEVKKVSGENTQSVYIRKSGGKRMVDREATLNKLKHYWTTKTLQSHDVVYLFVGDPMDGQAYRSDVSDATAVIATNGTLCSREPNAVVLRHSFTNGKFYYRAAKGTAYVLGSSPISFFVSVDQTALQKEIQPTLTRCQNPGTAEHGGGHPAVIKENVPEGAVLSC